MEETMSKKKPNGYWKDKERVIEEINRIMNEHGLDTLPPARVLRQFGQGGLVQAIIDHHGGFHEFRKLMGEGQLIIKRGEWGNEEFVIEQARVLMREHEFDSFPTERQLYNIGRLDIANAIKKHHHGFRAFRSLLGEDQIRVASGQWQDLEYTIQQATQVMQANDLDSLPAEKELRELGHSSIAMAIEKYHGGFPMFRELLGEDQRQKGWGVWKDKEYALEEARKIIAEHELASLPSNNRLREIGCGGLAEAISKYHGGMRKFRELLGESQKKRGDGMLKDQEYLKKKVREVMEENELDYLPSNATLNKLGYSSLGFAINNYHGGFRAFRETLGQEQRQKEKGLWKKIDYAVVQAKDIMAKHGFDVLPSVSVLTELGYSSLISAVSKYHGGLVEFRKLFDESTNGDKRINQLESLLDDYIGGNEDEK
jgi:hypothetical protein